MNCEKLVCLIQTDTTVGFSSKSKQKLNQIKNRPLNQEVLITTAYFFVLKKISRVPKKFKKEVRRSKKTTFIYSNNWAIRVVFDLFYRDFLKDFDFLYSTSANENKKKFSFDFAFEKADIIVIDKRGFFETKASKIFLLGKKKKKRLR